MIRLRTGQRWKREPDARPQDALALEVDGVDLLSSATDEPLATVLPQLLEAMAALMGGERVAQVSLPESHLELCLYRAGGDVELSVVSLGRPARRVRPPVRVDLLDLKDAAVAAGRSLHEDLLARAPRVARGAEVRAMVKTASRLARLGVAEALPEARPFVLERPPSSEPASEPTSEPASEHWAGFTLEDKEGRLAAYRPRAGGALASLLARGTVTLEVGGRRVWRAEEPPVLLAMELSRAAEDLVHAIDGGERRFSLKLPGARHASAVDLTRKSIAVGEASLPVDPAELARHLLELPIALSVAITARCRPQARNPYLEELTARCKRALAHLRAPTAPEPSAPAPKRSRRKAAAPPLPVAGTLKRLRFEQRWAKQRLGGEEPGSLVLSSAGPVFRAPEMAAGFSKDGGLLFRHVAPHGVAVSRDGHLLCADADRVMLFRSGHASATWLRDHDGLPLGPALVHDGGLLITASESRGAVAFSELTGRELWRFFPPRTHRAHLHVQGHRAVVTTDSGNLFGLDVHDGQLRYRVRAGVPFLGPAVAWGRKLCGWLGRRDRLGLLRLDVHSGKVEWTVELPFARPTAPLPVGIRLYVAGEHDGEGAIACVSARGELVWRRALHLGEGPYRLSAVGGAVAVCSQTGATTLIDADGEVRWHLGAAGEPLASAIAPCLSRQVLIVPGAQVRAVDPERGEVLAEVDAGATLCDLAVDRRLNLYLLDEGGDLRAYQLRTQLGVVGRAQEPE